ncbi:MAG: ribonuclease HIII [bacterium]|nr:ribonuclease HIII [bacterium]
MANNNNNYIVLKVDDETKQKMINFYKPFDRGKKLPYITMQAQNEDVVITIYDKNKKGENKVMFQGISSDVESSIWAMEQTSIETSKKEAQKDYSKYYYCSSIGSDEVGTGDYFGPIVVTSCYVSRENIPFVESLGIKDSKKLDDQKILKITPQLVKEIKYKSIILSNTEYNEKYNNAENNINKIKAIMHNKALWKMVNEENLEYDYIIVDEFAREARYYSYINESNKIQRGITFMTKAEDKNLAVACASVISRYIFLKEFDKICDELHIPLPKGAGPQVDTIGKEVVEKYGKGKLKEIAKLNFRNTQRILDTLIF